jgi:hypothetical protein
MKVDHDHGAYIQGWCDCIDWLEAGYHGVPESLLSAYYSPKLYKSWTAGCNDADQYLTRKQ